MQLKRIADSHELVVSDEWTEQRAGGSSSCAEWWLNPQYVVASAKPTTVVLKISRVEGSSSVGSDDKQAVVDAAVKHKLGLYVLKKYKQPNSEMKKAPNRVERFRAEEAVASTEFTDTTTETVMFEIGAEHEYVCIPALKTAGALAQFQLTFLSDRKLQMSRVADVRVVNICGEWDRNSAGGSHLHRSWNQNPQFRLTVLKGRELRSAMGTGQMLLRMRLSIAETGWKV